MDICKEYDFKQISKMFKYDEILQSISKYDLSDINDTSLEEFIALTEASSKLNNMADFMSMVMPVVLSYNEEVYKFKDICNAIDFKLSMHNRNGIIRGLYEEYLESKKNKSNLRIVKE